MYINVTEIRHVLLYPGRPHTILLELLDRKPPTAPAGMPAPPAGVEVDGDAATAPDAIRFLDRDVVGRGIR